MRLFTLFLLAALVASSVNAASYQKTGGTVVDPIVYHSVDSPLHPYAGNNLEPGADLVYADLSGADLPGATLTSANLPQATLIDTNLSNASLNYASLHGVDLRYADLTGADLSKTRPYSMRTCDTRS